jgi:hypothetical protein
LYPHCKGYSQNLEYEKAKVVLKGSSIELDNSDSRQILKEPGKVVDQTAGTVFHQRELCILAERLKNELGYQGLISA